MQKNTDLIEKSDVVIIGAGVIGCSIAYYLCKRGITDIVIIEKEAFPGTGARTPFDITNAIEERANTPLREGALAELEGRPRELLVEACVFT